MDVYNKYKVKLQLVAHGTSGGKKAWHERRVSSLTAHHM